MKSTNKNDIAALLFYLFIRQMGGLADCFRHVQIENALDSGELQGWKGHIQTELGDTLVLVEKTCVIFGLDLDETRQIGITRDIEKAEEYLIRHPDNYWV